MSKIDPDLYLDEDYSFGERRREARLRKAQRSGRYDEATLEDVLRHGAPEHLDELAVFVPSLGATDWERWWISSYLTPFYQNKVITDVLRKVRGGKEATVYCCAAHPESGYTLLAAKLYRPRFFRNLRNDARYRQGRRVLDEAGCAVRDERALRAVNQGTSFGKEVLHTSWLAHEHQALQTLHAAGVSVPRPIACGENVILMEYVGDLSTAAPALSQVRLPVRTARTLFDRLLQEVEAMLRCNCIHSDLSAYNVLYWDGETKIIDFPQMVDPRRHPEAFELLLRDVERLCGHFSRYGIRASAGEIVADLWARVGLPPAAEVDPAEG
jgi:RIO kinase 1